MLSLTQTHFIRPIVKTRAKKDEFVEPAEAPDEGRPDVTEGVPPTKHPIKQKIMEIFKIKEIDYKKFKKENMWAIRPNKKK